MSEMYGHEVPLYNTLLEIVRNINFEVLEAHPGLEKEVGCLDRVSQERHGAIRLGTARELRVIAGIFGVMGMRAVGYYDLSIAGLPVHSTAFRPVEKDELAVNPFRVFTSVLRMELLDNTVRRDAEEILSKREIITPALVELLAMHRANGCFDEQQAQSFICEALKTFQWHDSATVSLATYQRMLKVNSLVADIVCFRGPHINHLTPRVLDIHRVHRAMATRGIEVIPEVQGPPEKLPVLLKQTSFKALNEEIRFPTDNGELVAGKHRARFGEIELRGTALKPAGLAIYDRIMAGVVEHAGLLKKRGSGQDYFEAYTEVLDAAFAREFPARNIPELRQSDLGYFQYHLKPAGERPPGAPPKIWADASPLAKARTLADGGWLQAIPITYEDFLPVSAAGIFKSNLDEQSGTISAEAPNQEKFEEALGHPVLNPFLLYQTEEHDSISRALQDFEAVAGP